MDEETARLLLAAVHWTGAAVRTLSDEQRRLLEEHLVADFKEVVIAIQISSREVSLTVVDASGGRELLRVQGPEPDDDAAPDGQMH